MTVEQRAWEIRGVLAAYLLEIVCACVVLAILLLLAVLGPGLSAYNPGVLDPFLMQVRPSPAHLCGTTALGSDVCSQVLSAYRVDLGQTGAALALALGIGTLTGSPCRIGRTTRDSAQTADWQPPAHLSSVPAAPERGAGAGAFRHAAVPCNTHPGADLLSLHLAGLRAHNAGSNAGRGIWRREGDGPRMAGAPPRPDRAARLAGAAHRGMAGLGRGGDGRTGHGVGCPDWERAGQRHNDYLVGDRSFPGWRLRPRFSHSLWSPGQRTRFSTTLSHRSGARQRCSGVPPRCIR